MKCRWRNFLWLLLMAVVILNAAIFLSIPGSKHHEASAASAGQQDRAASHLQVLRKRLNANYNSSSSLHRLESSLTDLKLDKLIKPNDIIDKDGGNEGHKHNFDELERKIFEDYDNSIFGATEKPGHDKNNDGGGNSDKRGKPQGQGRNSPKGQGQGRYGSRANYSLPEVDAFIKLYKMKYEGTNFNTGDIELRYSDLLRKLASLRVKGQRLKAYVNAKGKKPWEKFHRGVRQGELYDPYDENINTLLKDMATKPIVDVEQKEGGTQIKLMITFEDEGQALFKPMRFPREQETLPDHFYFADYERHNAEIAAFHLDRILGFNRVPPTTGRMLNISRDLQKQANSKLAKTFFVSPVGNLCFHGQCSYYCDSSHPICGHPVMLEGSLAALLPSLEYAKRKTWRNPWKRSYSKHRQAYWEVYSDLCFKVLNRSPYNEGRRILDVLDISIFDFLIGNLDRHHYETFRDFGNQTFLLHLDQGRAFGKAKYDCISCLAPVRQCCMIRLSTLTKLIKLYQGPNSLSELMRKSMAADPISPILTEPHLDALDRRLSKILNVINGCLKEGRTWDDIVIDDNVS